MANKLGVIPDEIRLLVAIGDYSDEQVTTLMNFITDLTTRLTAAEDARDELKDERDEWDRKEDSWKHSAIKFQREAKEIKAALLAAQERERWIPTSERLPQGDERVWANHHILGVIILDRGEFLTPILHSHWKPLYLPSPPAKEKS